MEIEIVNIIRKYLAECVDDVAEYDYIVLGMTEEIMDLIDTEEG